MLLAAASAPLRSADAAAAAAAAAGIRILNPSNCADIYRLKKCLNYTSASVDVTAFAEPDKTRMRSLGRFTSWRLLGFRGHAMNRHLGMHSLL